MTADVLGWPLPVLLAALAVSLGAGVVRGFAGFGYSALTVAGLAMFVAPATVVPAVLALEVVASISMGRSALRDADPHWLHALLIGNALFIPVGIMLLAVLPDDVLRLLVAGALLVAAIALRLGAARALTPGRGLRAVAGMASGLLNGVAASGGVAAALLMTAARVPAERLRATMVSFLLVAGAYALVVAALMPTDKATALVSIETLRWALLLTPTMLAGIWLGKHSFTGADPARYRSRVLTLLIVISALGVVRAALALLHG